MQCLVHGTASNRLALISPPQERQRPKLPSWTRRSDSSTISSRCLSFVLWRNRKSFVYVPAARSITSEARVSSIVRPDCCFWMTLRRSSCRRVSSLSPNCCSYFRSIPDPASCDYSSERPEQNALCARLRKLDDPKQLQLDGAPWNGRPGASPGAICRRNHRLA